MVKVMDFCYPVKSGNTLFNRVKTFLWAIRSLSEGINERKINMSLFCYEEIIAYI
jgi:hypothetical protein